MLTVNAKLEMVLAFFDKRSDMVERRVLGMAKRQSRAEEIFLTPKLVNIIYNIKLQLLR